MTSLYIDVAPEGTDLADILGGGVTDPKSCNLFDPESYDNIANMFDIDTSEPHFKLAKSSNNPQEAIYNLLIARHLVNPSPAGTSCAIKDLVWLPVEGMHRWLSLLSLICASNYDKSGIVNLFSLSDKSLRTGLCINDDDKSVNILAIVKNERATLQSLFELSLTVHVYSAKQTHNSTHLSSLTVLTHLKAKSEVISTDKISSSSKSPIISIVEGFSFLSGTKFEGVVQTSAEYSSISKHFNDGLYSTIVDGPIYKNYIRNPSLGQETKIAR